MYVFRSRLKFGLNGPMGPSLGSVYPLSLWPHSAIGLQKQKNLEEKGRNRETLISRREKIES